MFSFCQVNDLPKTQEEMNASMGLFSGAERKTTHPHLPLCDTDHCPVLQSCAMLGENTLQRTIHAVGMHIAETKRDHTGSPGSTCGNQVPEAKVVDQHNTSLLSGFVYNACVW